MSDRTTLRPGPYDPSEDLTDAERIKFTHNLVFELKGAINASFANLYVRLDELEKSFNANMKLMKDQVRHHSTRIHQLELGTMNGDKK